jgi:hypothetical protein
LAMIFLVLVAIVVNIGFVPTLRAFRIPPPNSPIGPGRFFVSGGRLHFFGKNFF